MKKSIIPVAAFIAGMAIVPSVFAEDYDNYKALTNWAGVVECLQEEGTGYCDASNVNVMAITNDVSTVKGTKTLDLGDKTLTVNSDAAKAAFTVGDGASLTIKDGTIDSKDTKRAPVVVYGGGRLTIENTDIKSVSSAVWFKEATGKDSTITVDDNSTLEAAGNSAVITITNAANARTSTINIAGELDGNKAFAVDAKNGGNFNLTLSGLVHSDENDAIQLGGGTLILDGATVSAEARGMAAVSLWGGTVKVKNCATVAGGTAALYVAESKSIEEIAIINSTLKSIDGSVFDGKGEVKNVAISGSYLKAANDDTKVKGGDIKFLAYDYDGKEHTDVQLSQTDGSYGNPAVNCDATVEPGDEENKGEEAENPNTADTIATYLTIATVALLGLGATAFVAKKSNR